MIQIKFIVDEGALLSPTFYNGKEGGNMCYINLLMRIPI